MPAGAEAEEMVADFVGGEDAGAGELIEVADEDGPVGAVFGDAAVGAFDEGGIEGDDVHEHALAEGFFGELASDFELGPLDGGIKEELGGVVAAFAVDVHAAGEVGGFAVVLPVVVGEPALGIGDGDEIAAALVVEAEEVLFHLAEDLGDAGGGFEGGANGGKNALIVQVDVGDLMVGDGEGFGAAEIEGFAAEFVFDVEPALLAEDAVQVDGLLDVGDAVLGEEDDFDVPRFVEADEIADDVVDLTEVETDFLHVDADALEIVVEMGEVNEGEAGPVFFLDPLGALGDPDGGFDVGAGAPEVAEGKGAEVFFDAIPQGHGMRVDIEDFAAIRRVERARGD